MNNGSNAEQLRRQMADIRKEVGEDVEDIIDSAKTLSDWRYYVRAHPWMCAAAAAAVGYMVVPPRYEIISPDARTLTKLAKHNQVVVEANPKAQARTGWAGAAMGFLGTLVLREAMALAGRKLSEAIDPHATSNASKS